MGMKLASELPGILNWAIEGWQRLNQRGYFDLPDSSRWLIDHVSRTNNPVAAFLEERCQVDADATVTKTSSIKLTRTGAKTRAFDQYWQRIDFCRPCTPLPTARPGPTCRGQVRLIVSPG